MWSTRAALAAACGGLLFATLAAFCAAVYIARRASASQEVGQRAVRVADQVASRLSAAKRSGKRITARDSFLVSNATSTPPVSAQECATPLACRWVVTVSPLPELRNTLEPLPGYFLVLDAQLRLLYSSFAIRQLPGNDKDELNKVAITELNPGGDAAIVPLPGDTVLGGRMLLVARRDSVLQPNISRVVAGLPMTDADVPPQLLLGTMLMLAPLMLLVSLAVAYVVAGSTFKPIDHLITEVEAITDGRSLHRRVPAEEADEE